MNQPIAIGATSMETLKIRAAQTYFSAHFLEVDIFQNCQHLGVKRISYYFSDISNLEWCELHITITLPLGGISI